MLIAGIEPATSSLPWMRSANWAKSAYLKSILQLENLVKFPKKFGSIIFVVGKSPMDLMEPIFV